MARKLLSGSHIHGNERGTKRDYEIQRIETFSDGVFAFAVTLLIVSLEVPKTFEELLVSMRGFFAFGISFVVLVSIWSEQHRFFRNYGMEDGWTITLNGALLFIVLFYTYPLKFLFTLMFRNQIYGEGKSPLQMTTHQMPQLMVIYAAGFITIYLLFFLMYLRAARNSKELGLSAAEKFDCKTSMYKELIMIAVGACSLLLALVLNDDQSGYAGMIYLIILPALTIYFFIRKPMRRKQFPKALPAD
jgi:uncharacterized membrane protein